MDENYLITYSIFFNFVKITKLGYKTCLTNNTKKIIRNVEVFLKLEP